MRPRVKPRWAKLWGVKIAQYKPECYAMGVADPVTVEHLVSVGAGQVSAREPRVPTLSGAVDMSFFRTITLGYLEYFLLPVTVLFLWRYVLRTSQEGAEVSRSALKRGQGTKMAKTLWTSPEDYSAINYLDSDEPNHL